MQILYIMFAFIRSEVTKLRKLWSMTTQTNIKLSIRFALLWHGQLKNIYCFLKLYFGCFSFNVFTVKIPFCRLLWVFNCPRFEWVALGKMVYILKKILDLLLLQRCRFSITRISPCQVNSVEGRIWISQAENRDQLLLGSSHQMVFSGSLKWHKGGQHFFGSQQAPSEGATSTIKWDSYHSVPPCSCNILFAFGRRDRNNYAHAKSRRRLYNFSKLFYSSFVSEFNWVY